MRNRTDGELMKLVMGKNHLALEELYDRYAKLVYSFALKSMKEEQAAREIVQLVFTRLWTTEKGFDASKGAFVNWVITVTRNITIDYLRQKRKLDQVIRFEPKEWENELVSGDPDPDLIMTRKWIGEQIHEAYVHLSESQIQLIDMMYWQGYSLSEIATRMNEPLGTIKSRLHQCLKILRKHLTAVREG
ncbi:DNA-directed RNA polymerase sigma-70 factor [Paenibacillus marchantiophytorum]|uniref:DNA-directed RNA polymerase sigma-70 factor n=1 Tax=Paenibacillus marchantiophytorum TaxID=1619310 RepID=A0ABQ1F8S7_9BACL|nr:MULTISPECIES: sigma-70 family RNA polymerase sigma factor [Paenibacillus]UKS25098.1 sigma-70 family RNA polymerase sigma factor [Paenibacillus sp. HWE-109]GGA03322.1 DNA-directed RNA polymerase sigma-70 factor [Paenibacillus marchantiophytorum]